MDDLSQYQELYIQTSKEYIQSLNGALLKLEKQPTDKTAIEEVFRSAHSLKSQSAAMGFASTAYLCHVIEDVFYEIKSERQHLSAELADQLFKALDALTNSLTSIEKQNQEADLSGPAEILKQSSGVNTAGVGKTIHADEKTQTVETPLADEPAKETITTIAVKVEVLDEMMNLLENLLIQRLKLKRIKVQEADQVDLKDYINASDKILASLQHQIMKARAVPVGLVFEHFPRAVRDLARSENKQIDLVITGSDLELDRTIVDRLDEPIIHLLRNAVSHGIKEKGTITLSARRQKDFAEISVADNGQGINWQQIAEKAGLPKNEANTRELKEALFSGVSTSESVTQISGRGVGLKVIKKMVDNFGGSIDVISELEKGTTFTIKLPLTLAIVKALIVTVNKEHFALPTLAVEQLVNVPMNTVRKIADQEAFILNDTEIPLIRMAKRLAPLQGTSSLPVEPTEAKHLLTIIVGTDGEKVGLVVDSVEDTTDIVIRPVPDVLKAVPGFSGVTILSDGQTALIINPQEMF